MRNLTASLLIQGSILLMLLNSLALGQSSASRDTVLSLLSGYEHILSQQELENLGPELPHILMQIVQDPSLKKYHRLRALGLLQHYPGDPEVETFLTGLLSEKELPSGFRRATILTLGRTAKTKAIPTLTPYLSSKDVHIREAAARGLMDTGDPSVVSILKEAAQKESEPFLRKHFTEMSDRLDVKSGDKDDRGSRNGPKSKPEGSKSQE